MNNPSDVPTTAAHPILASGTLVRIVHIRGTAGQERCAVDLPGCIGVIESYVWTYPESWVSPACHYYRVDVPSVGILTLFDDEFEPVD